MSNRATYTVEIAGLIRHLPLFEVVSGVRIAIFNMLGDTYVVKAAAAALAEKLKARQLCQSPFPSLLACCLYSPHHQSK